jgi:hypothetical protein
MELLETQDPEKRRLIETSDRHKRELEKELNGIRTKTERVMTNALIIGGALALSYFVISQFSGSKKEGKKKHRAEEEGEENEIVASAAPSFLTQIGTKVINQATLILLDMAREKLEEYLHERRNSNENS